MTETVNRKKELMERTIEEFQKMTEDNKMFILGYMVGIQQQHKEERQQQDMVVNAYAQHKQTTA